MLAYFLKYWVGGTICLLIIVFLASLILSSLPKVIISILGIALIVWFLVMFFQILKAEYAEYQRQKPFNDAMKQLQKQVLKDLRTEIKKIWANRKNRQ